MNMKMNIQIPLDSSQQDFGGVRDLEEHKF